LRFTFNALEKQKKATAAWRTTQTIAKKQCRKFIFCYLWCCIQSKHVRLFEFYNAKCSALHML